MAEKEICFEIDEHILETITGPKPKLSGFCVWKWVASDQKWVKMKDYSAPGYDPGNGPADGGRYDGQIIRWASVIWND